MMSEPRRLLDDAPRAVRDVLSSTDDISLGVAGRQRVIRRVMAEPQTRRGLLARPWSAHARLMVLGIAALAGVAVAQEVHQRFAVGRQVPEGDSKGRVQSRRATPEERDSQRKPSEAVGRARAQDVPEPSPSPVRRSPVSGARSGSTSFDERKEDRAKAAEAVKASRLAQELRILDAARRALAGGSLRVAERHLQTHRVSFSDSELEPERTQLERRLEKLQSERR